MDFQGNINVSVGSGNTSTSGQYSTSQNIQMVESICEGPIRGLRYGPASVFFNNVRAKEISQSYFQDNNNGDFYQSVGTITFSGSSKTGTTSITVPSIYHKDYSDSNNFRYLHLKTGLGTYITITFFTRMRFMFFLIFIT